MNPDEYQWIELRNCKDAPTSAFFDRAETDNYALARILCASCEVKPACLEAGMHESDGLWGGLDPGEREMVKRKRREIARARRNAA